MTYVDANVFLRALTEPTTPRGRQNQAAAQHFFELVHGGQETYTATTVAIHEAFFALTGKRANGYGLAPAEACARMRPLMELPGFRHHDKQAMLDAMSLWVEHPEIGFSDAFTAVAAATSDAPLLTFDSDFDDLPHVDRYQPAA